MKAARYANAFVQNTSIKLGDESSSPFGTLLSEYDVQEYWDLRTSSRGSAPVRAYVVSMRQRLTLANLNASGFGGPISAMGYNSYPVLAVQSVAPSAQDDALNFYLEDYSPKTLNSSVNVSANSADSESQSRSIQHTSGSSVSNTNGYEVSGSLGFFGEAPTGSIGGGFSSSTTTTTEQSTALGSGSEQGKQLGAATSMSIKDWASYAYVDVNKQNPSWVWGQEYPWNVIDFRYTSDGSSLTLPDYVQKQLCDGKFVYPPSQIAQFGINFVAHAKWVFWVDGDAGQTDELVNFKHLLTYWTGSHSANGAAPNLQLQVGMQSLATNKEIETVQLNLPVLALNHIARTGAGNGAILGFVKSEFLNAPGNGGFRLKSNANNLYATMTQGFGPVEVGGGDVDDDALMTALNVTTSAPAEFTVQFKVVDPDLELSLHLKHWKASKTGCLMIIKVNGQSITRHIDSMSSASGTDNITSITLRSRDYTSHDYNDYLVMGLNEIKIAIAPDGGDSADYVLRALAIQ